MYPNNNNLDHNSKVQFCGMIYSPEEFNAKFYPTDSYEDTIAAMNVLLDKGKAKLIINRTKEQKMFESVMSEESFKAEAHEHILFEEQHEDFRAAQKREGRAVYPKIEFDFPNLLKAKEFIHNMMKAKRFVEEPEIVMKLGVVIVRFFNVTDSEINYMTRLYKADKFIGNTINYAEKGAQGAADAVHYTATKIVAPVVQIAARAGVNILKTAATTLAKTAGSFITAGSQGVKESARQIRYDPDVLKAGKELIETKDAISRKVANFGGVGGGSGIRVG